MNAAFGARFFDLAVLERLPAALLADRLVADRLAVVRPAVLLATLLLADVFLADALFLAVLLARPVVLDFALVWLVRLATLAGMGFAPGHASIGC